MFAGSAAWSSKGEITKTETVGRMLNHFHNQDTEVHPVF
jgi:hypothetical protein